MPITGQSAQTVSAARAAYLDELAAANIPADLVNIGANIAGLVAAYVSIRTVTEIFDGQFAAGVDYTVAVNGIFSCYSTVGTIDLHWWSDGGGGLWKETGLATAVIECAIGEANKLRFENEAGGNDIVLVLKLG